MQVDLSFRDGAAEEEYRRQRLELVRQIGGAIDWMRLLVCLVFVARLSLLHASQRSIAAAVLACLAVGTQLATSGREDLRCGVDCAGRLRAAPAL